MLNKKYTNTFNKKLINSTKEIKITKGFKSILAILIISMLSLISLFGFYIVDNDNNETLEIYYLDVGQGDCAYIKINDYDILIDAGPKSSSDNLLEQLSNLNIDDFEIIIATHPHEDHIGGMPAVFEAYDVESFYTPQVSHTTKTFENMITSIKNEGIDVQIIKEGMHFDLGIECYIDVYSPIYESYDNFNDYSPIMKLVFNETSFMFTGDAEAHVEQDVVAKYPEDLKADVLKLGHHGSSTSSSIAFIESVNPTYAIISCGLNNKYGHPHAETLNTLNEYNIKAYRTDLQGTIKVISDGKTISITTEK